MSCSSEEQSHGNATRCQEQWPPQYVTSEIIQVKVGREQKVYNVHKDLLCQNSAFFAGCLRNDTFEESVSKEVCLVDDDPRAFDLIIIWLYQQQLNLPAEDTQLSPVIMAYILADKLIMERCMNAIMDAFRSHVSEYRGWFAQLLRVQKLDLPESCPLQHLFIDACAWDMLRHRKGSCFGGNETSLTHGGWTFFEHGGKMVANVMKIVITRNLQLRHNQEPMSSPWDEAGCHYHSHKGDPYCPWYVEASQQQ